MVRLEELEKQRKLQKSELSSANSRISQLEGIISDNNLQNDKRQHSSNYLNDELKAWKELVEHQKAIMEKIRIELEDTQLLVREKDRVIGILNRPSSNTSHESLKYEVETQTNESDNYNQLESDRFEANIISKMVFDANNDSEDDEFGLNKLFNGLDNDDLEEKNSETIDTIIENNKMHNENNVNDDNENTRMTPHAWNESENDKIRSNTSSRSSYVSNDFSDVRMSFN